MSVGTTSSSSANLPSEYYHKKALMTMQPRLQLYKLGIKAPLPKNAGKLAKWLIYTKQDSKTTALSEGVTPSSGSFTTANITATIAQYGDYTQVSDLLEDTAIDPVVARLSELYGEAAGETVEDLIISHLDANLTVRRANGKLTSDNNIISSDVIILKDFLKATIALKVAYVGAHEMGKYMCSLHPSNEYDLLSETNVGGWLDVNSYVGLDKGNIMRAEVGSVYGMRFFTSDKMTSADNSGSVNVKKNYVIGKECFGVVELGGKNFEIIKKDRKSGGVANPLELFSTVGWKMPGFVVKNFAAARGIVLKGASSFA